MAKICPLSGKGVIYLTCSECEHKDKCRRGELNESDDRRLFMKEGLPECRLNTCKHYYNGNCTDMVRYENCIYAKQCKAWDDAKKAVENLVSDYVPGAPGYNGSLVQTRLSVAKEILDIMDNL